MNPNPYLPAPKPIVRVQTVCQRTIVLPQVNGQSVTDLKSAICEGKSVYPEEIQLISEGRECHETEEATTKCFALVRSNACRCVPIFIKVTTGDKKMNQMISLTLPLNTRVSKLKTLLLKEKHTKWSITGQRLISMSKVMKDHHILGDFMLHHSSFKKRNGERDNIKPLTLFLSQTIDSKTEMEIIVTLRNNQEIKFYFEFGIPLYYAKDILHKQYAVPRDTAYFFEIEGGKALADMNKSLLDYGILPSQGKKMRTTLVMGSPMPPVQPLFSGGMKLGDAQIAMVPLAGLTGSGVGVGVATAASVKTTAQSPSILSISTTMEGHGVSSRAPSPSHLSAANLKKVPDSKRKSPTCSMFGGMKKGFLSLSKRKKS